MSGAAGSLMLTLNPLSRFREQQSNMNWVNNILSLKIWVNLRVDLVCWVQIHKCGSTSVWTNSELHLSHNTLVDFQCLNDRIYRIHKNLSNRKNENNDCTIGRLRPARQAGFKIDRVYKFLFLYKIIRQRYNTQVKFICLGET